MSGTEFVSQPASPFPWMLWNVEDQNTNIVAPAVPAGQNWVVVGIDIFFYGDGGSAEWKIGTSDTSGFFLDWRPETAATQSLHWSGFQVVFSSLSLFLNIDGGTFDTRISGWVYPAPAWTPI